VPKTTDASTGLLASSIKSMPDFAHELLRRDISGVLPPDAPLKQAHIASRLGLSLGPIREALQRLESEGLVVSQRHRGYFVSSLDPAEIDDIFEMRMWIEGRTSYLSAERRTDDDIARMEDILQEMEACSAAAPPNLGRWSALNREFHVALFQISGRHQLARMAIALLDSVERYVWVDYAAGDGLRAAEVEHRQIFEAFKAQDATMVRALSQDHCRHTRQRLIESLQHSADRAQQPVE
jgi:DNA-binding GntR family transcriptional regulator